MKALRTFLCVAAILFCTNLIFYLFGIATPPVANFILDLYQKWGFFSFWILFLIVGFAIVSLLWSLFKLLSGILIRIVLQLNPYPGVTFTLTILIALGSAIYSIYTLWHVMGWPSFVLGLIGIIISSMMLSLGFLIIRVAAIKFGYMNADDENY